MSARQEVRYQRLQEAEKDDPEEVTVHLYSHSSRRVHRARCRDAGLRICSSLLLLAVAFGFVLYELEYGSVEPPSAQQSFSGRLGPPWNVSTISVPTNHHGAHHHSEDLDLIDEHEDHGDDEHSEGSDPASHSHSAGTYHHAAVVTDSESCSGVARDVLAGRGSVVDAGIAAVLCLAVVHPHTVSLGGTFASIHLSGISQNASVLNAIPSEASPITYGIPSLLQGLWSLHRDHGRNLWSDLVSPAINLAKQGFVVDSSLHAALEKNQNKTKSSEGLQGLFYHQNILKGAGASVSNVQLGNVLEIAQTMRNSALPDVLVQQLLGDLEIIDREQMRKALSRMHLISENPLQLHLDGLTLYSSPAPTMGGILARSVQEMSRTLEQNKDSSVSDLLINASKAVYSLAGVKPSDFTTDVSAGAQRQWDLAPVGSNVLVADSDGNVLVISLTLNSTFGSGFVSPSTGILLSDFHQGVSVPFSSWACPTVLVGSDNDVMGLAAQGGSSLPFSLARVLLRHVLLKMDLTESINGTLTDLLPADSDPWLKYFGLPGVVPAMAIELRSEHVHVATSQSCSCHSAGL